MKKNLFVVAAVALVAMVSCNKEEVNNGGVEPQKPSVVVEFVASVDTEATKTQLNAGKTEWLEGDAISINGVKFTTEDSGESVTFTNAEELPAEFDAPYTAIYPYSATEGTATVPAEQIVSNGTFADDVVVAVAYVESGNTLSFKHVSSVVKFQVATEGVSELTFSSSTDLAGTINVKADASYEVNEGSKTITVTPKNGTFDTSETYYVSVLPTLGEGKVDFAVKAEDVVVKSGNVNFKRNTIMDAKSITIKYIEFAAGSWAKQDDAAIGAYFFGNNGEKWVKMTPLTDYNHKCVVPEGQTNVIFCRLDPKGELGWSSKWNQTADLTLPIDGKYRFVVDATGNWEGANGDWTDPAEQIYFNPGAWTSDNAWFAAYFFGNGEKWEKFTDKNIDGIYECGRPKNYNSIIFCRMDSQKNELSWDSKWNQSADIVLPSNGDNYFTVNTGGNWEGANGTWKKW